MGLFSRLFNSISAGLFSFIVLRNLESIESAEELDKIISDSQNGDDADKTSSVSISDAESKFADAEKSDEIPPVKNGDKFATRRELAISIKKLLEEINRKNNTEEFKGKMDILTTANNTLVEENAELRNQIEQLKNDMEKISSMLIKDNSGSISNSNEIKAEKKIDFSELSMCETIDLFILNGAKYSISVNSPSAVKKYIKTVLNLDKIEAFLKENSEDEEFELFEVGLESYETALKKKTKEISIMMEDYSPDDISGIVTMGIFKIITSCVIEKWIPSIYKHLHNGREEKYMMFLRLINEYLESVGVYTYNELSKGDKMSEEYLNFFKPVRIQTNGEDFKDVVKEIHMLPYCINYLEYGEKTRHYTMGIAEVYTTEDII